MSTPSSDPPRSDRIRPTEQASERANEFRRSQTTPEMILWKRLRSRRLADLKFRRQHPLGPYIADFYCHESGLVVDLDSAAHDGRRDHDERRDEWMRDRGIETLRVRAADVNRNLDGVLLLIRDRAIARINAIEARKNEKKT